VECDQFGDEQAAEQLSQNAHGDEECWPRGDPALSIEGDAAAGHDHVHMGVVGQCRSPLAAASVGVAMGGGTDVALETADAALLRERVVGIAELVGLSRSTLSNIRQNVGVALGLKAIFLVTTLAGITGLWPAILADTGATVLVTINALRLLRWTPAAVRLG
jgi:hypothetical protein